MAKQFDKKEIRAQLTIENIFDLLEEWGGEPEYTDFGITATTICHNPPGEGSRKLYYYENTDLFQCYTGCGSFDIFQLLTKVADIQWNKVFDLNDSVRYIATKCGLQVTNINIDKEQLEDWDIFDTYDRIQNIDIKDYKVELKEYDDIILSRMNYNVRIEPWLKEGISQEVIDKAKIGYYPGGAQITIPHYDINNKFVGLRGRSLVKKEAELYGKYRPVMANKQLYNHPLGMNLYNINNAKDNIKAIGKAIVFEAEKSTLKFQSYFGIDNDISVACCGSNISTYQVELLLECNCKEMIIAFDRQFQEIGDDEFHHLTDNLTKINNKYKNYIDISIMFDKKMLTGYKDSPIDDGQEIFMKLYKERIKL